MIRARWNTDGLRAAVENARALGKELADEKVLRPSLLAVGKPLLEDIVRTAPRDQTAPHMADDFVCKASTEDRSEGRETVLVGPRNPRAAASNGAGWRAPLLEFGTSRHRAQPFIRPAFDRLASTFTQDLTAELRRHYARVVTKYTRRAK